MEHREILPGCSGFFEADDYKTDHILLDGFTFSGTDNG
jgi:hypothetical protein